MDGIALNAEPPGAKNSYWMVTAVWDPAFGKAKNAVVNAMRERGVDARPFFHPLSSLPAYAGRPEAEAARARNVVAYDVGARAVNLPSGFNMTPELAERSRDALLACLRG